MPLYYTIKNKELLLLIATVPVTLLEVTAILGLAVDVVVTIALTIYCTVVEAPIVTDCATTVQKVVTKAILTRIIFIIKSICVGDKNTY